MEQLKNCGLDERVSWVTKDRSWRLWACMALVVLVTLAAFLSSLDNGFVNWDDPQYVTENVLIRDLSWISLKRIFSSTALASYVPLVLLSFSLEYSIWGLNPFGYHLTNLLLHTGNTLLVFALVVQMSRRLLPALAAALFFGVHPLHVESVAWVAERKDLLSTLFFLSALLLYIKYREERGAHFYLLSMAAFVLSLLSKSMAVTLPLILFLYDYLSAREWTIRTVLEKLPFFLLSGLFGAVEILVQHSGGGIDSVRLSTPGNNLLVATQNLFSYLGKTLVPVGLSVYYPYPANVSLYVPEFFLPVIALLMLAGAVSISLRYTREVVFGTLFFLLTILPVLMLLPFGPGAVRADRYMYIPSVGLFYLAGLAFQRTYIWKTKWGETKKICLIIFLSLTVLTFSVLTWQRCRVWQDSETLWRDVLERFPGVSLAHINLGNAYEKTGKLDLAVDEYKKALAMDPSHIAARFMLAGVYERKGLLDAAIEEYRSVLTVDPKNSAALINLGDAYRHKGMLDEAMAEYRKILIVDPGNAAALISLGNAYRHKGMLDEAVSEYKRALAIDPNYAAAHVSLGLAYMSKGQVEAAVQEYQKALLLDPTIAVAHYNLGNIFARKGELDSAIAEYKKAVALDPGFIAAHVRLASAYRKKGMADAAMAQMQKVLAINPPHGPATEPSGPLDE